MDSYDWIRSFLGIFFGFTDWLSDPDVASSRFTRDRQPFGFAQHDTWTWTPIMLPQSFEGFIRITTGSANFSGILRLDWAIFWNFTLDSSSSGCPQDLRVSRGYLCAFGTRG